MLYVSDMRIIFGMFCFRVFLNGLIWFICKLFCLKFNNMVISNVMCKILSNTWENGYQNLLKYMMWLMSYKLTLVKYTIRFFFSQIYGLQLILLCYYAVLHNTSIVIHRDNNFKLSCIVQEMGVNENKQLISPLV